MRNCRAKAALNLDGPTLSVLGGWLELQPAQDMPADPVARLFFLGRIQSRSSAVDQRLLFVQPLLGRSLVCDSKVARKMT